MRQGIGGAGCRALVIVLTTAVGICALACVGPGPQQTPSSKELRVGIAPGDPPLAFLDNEELMGIEPDLAQRLGQGLELDVRYVLLPEEELIPALLDHRVDILMSGLKVTPERSEQVLFARPYLRVGQEVLIRGEDAERYADTQALRVSGARVGFVRGTAGGLYVGEQLRSSEAYAFASVNDAIRNLRARRIDFFIHDATTVWRYSNTSPNQDAGAEDSQLLGIQPPLTEEHLAWAIAPDDVALKSRVDDLLLSWRAGGELDALLARWIPTPSEAQE